MAGNDRLIHQLLIAQQKMRTHIKKALLRENVRVTLGQTGILFLLQKNNGQAMTELSNVLRIDNSTLTGLVDRLEKFDFVRRKASKIDRRKFRIYITAEGALEADRAKPIIESVNEEIKSGFSEEQIGNFMSVLKSFSQKF